MEGLILQFDSLMMSFGGVKVDQHGITDRFPGLSLFSGLIGNALGWFHGDIERLQQLQSRLLVASRWDILPKPIVDYHTVDLGQEKMRNPGWTTRGRPEHRAGGSSAKFGTHPRYRHYLANGILTSVVSLRDKQQLDIAAIETALKKPARPLFIGRKTCLPSGPILGGRVSGENVLKMLENIPRAKRAGTDTNEPMPARWPAEIETSDPGQVKTIYDQRNWASQMHEGSREVAEGLIKEAS